MNRGIIAILSTAAISNDHDKLICSLYNGPMIGHPAKNRAAITLFFAFFLKHQTCS
jgi:hypothetical protein